jgi:indole-3-glycerol phosphate synthase
MFLQKAAAAARERLEEAKRVLPPGRLLERVAERKTPPLLSARLRRPEGGELRVVAEVKRKSPSRGWIKRDLDVEETVQAYRDGGADALSVLTEPRFFAGSLEDLHRASQAASLPVLRKDFIVDSYQLLESRAAGASAVLLIAALLPEEELLRLLHEAGEAGLEALVEVHDEKELERALRCGAALVGINNRDLRTLEVDMNTTLRLAPMVPDDVVVVSESGYRRPEEAERAREAGVDALLVGESLVRHPRPGDMIRALKGRRK